MTIGDRIRQRRIELGMKTQGALAKAVKKFGGAISQAQISQLERGMTAAPRALPHIARALQTTVDWLTQGIGGHAGQTQSRLHTTEISPTGHMGGIVTSLKPLLIYKSVVGVGDHSGEVLIYKTNKGAIARPMDLDDSENAFAFKMRDHSLSPAYDPNDTLLIDPSGTPVELSYCLFVKDPDGDPMEGIARRLVNITDGFWIVRQYKPAEIDTELSRKEYPHAWLIYGKYNAR